MGRESLFQVMQLPVLASLFVFYFAFRALVLHDETAVVSRNFKVTKDVEGYTKTAGLYYIGFGISMIIYGFLLYYNYVYAFVFAGIVIVSLVLMWKHLNQKHEVKKIS